MKQGRRHRRPPCFILSCLTINLIEKFRGGGKSGAKINDDNPARELFNYLGTVTPSAASDLPARNPNRMFYKN